MPYTSIVEAEEKKKNLKKRYFTHIFEYINVNCLQCRVKVDNIRNSSYYIHLFLSHINAGWVMKNKNLVRSSHNFHLPPMNVVSLFILLISCSVSIYLFIYLFC